MTHLIFYTAMLDSGVSPHYAKLLYYGVRIGGPKWKVVEQTSTTKSSDGTVFHTAKVVDLPTRPVSEAQLREFDKTLTEREQAGNPVSLEEINALARIPTFEKKRTH